MTTTNSKKKPLKKDLYAIVEASGQQFWLQNDRYYDLDRLNAEVDDTLTIDKVLLINDGKEPILGMPYIKDASVTLKILSHRRGPKIIVYKMRPKKKTRRKNGHRQELTRVLVQSISTTKGTKEVKKTAKTTTTPKATTKTKLETASKGSKPSKPEKTVKDAKETKTKTKTKSTSGRKVASKDS